MWSPLRFRRSGAWPACRTRVAFATIAWHGALAIPALSLLLLASPASAQRVRRDFDMTNGPVHAVAVDGNTLYVGGDFTRVGPPTGAAASISKASGRPIHFQHIRGEVYAVVADGYGGWFVGGDFSSVGDEKRSCLIHVLADGSMSPMISNGTAEVYALAVSGNTLYLGGHFTDLLGKKRHHIAAIDIPTETVLPWNPNSGYSYSNQVYAIAVHDGIVYAGGDFTWFAGHGRNYAIAIDETGWVLDWNPDANAPVRSIAIAGDAVYLGGSFTTMGGQARVGIAAVQPHGAGAVLDWNAQSNGEVRSVLVRGSTVLAGGIFSAIGGASRAGIAALDAVSGLATAWDPHLGSTPCCPEVNAIALDGTRLLVGGKFTSIGGEPRAHIGAVDVESAVPTAWDPGAEDIVFALGVGDDVVYAGGVFRSIGGVPRNRLAAIDVPSGRATDWNPGANQVVRALAVSGPIVYAGGSFDSIGGTRRKGIAALDAATGSPTAWNPRAEGAVRAIVADGSTVYVGGSFSQISLQPRAYVAALDAVTGEATSWDPDLDGTVRALAKDGSTLYVGGDFEHAGATTRHLVASLDLATGALTDWEANPVGPTHPQIYALGVSGSAVFAGGDYAEIGEQPRRNIASVDRGTGLATPWDAGVNTTIYSLAIEAGYVYYGGRFGFLAREAGAMPGPGFGVATEIWCCGLGNDYGLGTVQALAAQGRNVFVGGTYNRIGPEWRSGISVVENLDVATPTLLSMFQAEVTERGIELHWQFADDLGAESMWIERATSAAGPWTRLDLAMRLESDAWVAIDREAANGREWFYRIGRQSGGETTWFGPIAASARADLRASTLVFVAPNPTARQSHIDFVVARAGRVRLTISDLQGRIVAPLVDGTQGPGRYRATWSGEDTRGAVSPGIYFVTFEAEGVRQTRRLVVAR
jgi:trimeric autotransporter adhesin